MTDTPIERRLDALARQHPGPDGLLRLLLAISGIDNGLPFPIGVLVDGAVIRGGLTAPRVMAEALDEGTSQVVHGLEQTQGNDWGSLREAVTSAFESALEASEKLDLEAEAAIERYESYPTIDEVSDEDFAAYLRVDAPPRAIDIRDAQIFVGGATLNIGILRVAVSRIGAWWPLAAEPEVTVHFAGARPPA